MFTAGGVTGGLSGISMFSALGCFVSNGSNSSILTDLAEFESGASWGGSPLDQTISFFHDDRFDFPVVSVETDGFVGTGFPKASLRLSGGGFGSSA